jgi:hypothetical protein
LDPASSVNAPPSGRKVTLPKFLHQGVVKGRNNLIRLDIVQVHHLGHGPGVLGSGGTAGDLILHCGKLVVGCAQIKKLGLKAFLLESPRPILLMKILPRTVMGARHPLLHGPAH